MTNDKACGVALLDQLGKHFTLEIESQYTKSDVIFYKFKNSNIAVSKKLNNLDFSILSKDRDWVFLLQEVNDEYLLNKDYINSKAHEYSVLIHGWSEDKSIIAKMHRFMNDEVLNDSTIISSVKKLEENEKFLELLLNNKAVIAPVRIYNGTIYGGMTLDVSLRRRFNQSDIFDQFQVIVSPTDHNIDIVKRMVANLVESTDEEDNIIEINRINFLVGLLIMRYNLLSDDDNFQLHSGVVFCLNGGGSYVNDRSFNSQNFEMAFSQVIRNVLNSQSGLIVLLLQGRSNHYDLWGLRGSIRNNLVNLRIDYPSMTNEHLLLFKNSINWLIDRHARYINVRAKGMESYLMFLGSNELEGKKKTREVLNSHLNLSDMNTEIERRGL